MSSTEVLLYQELDGTIPVLDWLKELQRTNRRAFEKCLFLLNLLEEFGHELRRPRADLLRDGVYELRTEVRNVHYRLLYGFVGKDVAVVAHGLPRKQKCLTEISIWRRVALNGFVNRPKSTRQQGK